MYMYLYIHVCVSVCVCVCDVISDHCSVSYRIMTLEVVIPYKKVLDTKLMATLRISIYLPHHLKLYMEDRMFGINFIFSVNIHSKRGNHAMSHWSATESVTQAQRRV